MTTSVNNSTISRRSVLTTGARLGVGAAVLSVTPTTLFAGVKAAATTASGRTRMACEPTLAKYLCRTVHDKIASNLDDVINDPAIDGEQTALALMEARCPGCRKRVHPAKSSLSVVIPQWKMQTGVAA